MSRRRFNRRGLAEIVGTVILVAIVVAAAAAFSLFVATYQSQLQKEEKANHERALESVRITNITETLNGRDLVVQLASGDVNWMNLTGYQVNGADVNGWNFQPAGGAKVTCSWPSTNPTCTELPPLENATATLVLTQPLDSSSTIDLGVFTALSNLFTYVFLPPVPIIKVAVLPIGNASIPLFNGSGSYEPRGGDNASVTHWGWSFTPVFNNLTGPLSISGSNVNDSLNFSPTSPPDPSPASTPRAAIATTPPPSTSGPVSRSTIEVTASLHPSATDYTISFVEQGLTSGSMWTVSVQGTTANLSSFKAGATTSGVSASVLVPNGSYTYWVNVSSIAPEPWSYSGPQVEVMNLESSLSSGKYYYVRLAIANSDGLTANTSVLYET